MFFTGVDNSSHCLPVKNETISIPGPNGMQVVKCSILREFITVVCIFFFDQINIFICDDC